MPKEETKLTEMSCPACGFRVFNRRYAKCERCASDLPPALVYSEQERRALLEVEKERLSLALKHRALHRSAKPSRRQRSSSSASASAVSTSAPTSDGATDATVSPSDGFVSGGAGVFDGGGASGSFGEDGGSSSRSD
jgi:uncharacterized membrane protein YgcG